LKLWSIIKYFGLAGIETLIDERLALTSSIQSEIRAHQDLILLNETDINSCIFQYIPDQLQTSQLSVADLEKINDINLGIKSRIIADGEAYVHGFTLKSCLHNLFPAGYPVYVLRTLNGNPKTTLQDAQSLLNRVHDIGTSILRNLEYVMLPESPRMQSLSVFQKLKTRLQAFFGVTDHVALIYGSCASSGNRLYSDVDLMVFAADKFCTLENKPRLKDLFEGVMAEEGFPLDNEVPLEVKLLIGFSEARIAAQAKCQIKDGKVISVERDPAFLGSRVMLDRLIFNVLTVPTIPVSGSEDLVLSARADAEASLVELIASIQTAGNIKQTSSLSTQTAEKFIELALTDGTRAGEEYLGYKNRPEVLTHLTHIFDRQAHRPTPAPMSAPTAPRTTITPETTLSTTSPPCILFLNGFPGVGKYTVARKLAAVLPNARLLDNHALIDPVEAIEPGRTPEHYSLRKAIRTAAFKGIKESPRKDLAMILTSCTSSSPADMAVFEEYLDIARHRKIPFVSVNITCSDQANVARLVASERADGRKSKLTDASVLDRLKRDAVLLDPRRDGVDVAGVEQHHFELDNTNLSPEEAAMAIAGFVEKVGSTTSYEG
jgi:hypothetical protein